MQKDTALRTRTSDSIRANREGPRLVPSRSTAPQAGAAVDPGSFAREIKEKLARETAAGEDVNPLEVLERIVDGYSLLAEEKRMLYEEIRRELFGYGPLEAYMTDPSVTEVIYDSHDRGFVERDGNLEDADYRFSSPEDLEHYVQNLIKPVGRPLDERNTNLNAKLPDGTRINATCPPQSVEYTLNLRKPPATVKKFPPAEYVASGACTMEMLDFLGYYHKKRANIIIVGATSTGKTTVIRIEIENYSDPRERWIMLEETRELECDHPRYLSFQQVQRGKNKEDWFRLVDIFDQSVLRKRPDRIGVGEILGEEVVALIRGISAGHEGFIGSMHAGSPEKTVFLLVIKLKEAGLNLGEEYIRQIVHECLDFIVVLKRTPEGRRIIDGIWEVFPLSAGESNPFRRIYFYNHETGRFEKDQDVSRSKAEKFGLPGNLHGEEGAQ
jgi:pilus assembly protein CpaF